jgi:hypothetical protein
MWRVFVNARGDADVTDRDGLAIRWADNAFPFWNMIFLREQIVDPRADADLAEVRERHSGFCRGDGGQ